MNQKVSEYSRERQILHESDQRYRELVDFMPQAIFEMDLEGNFTYVNHFALESFGYVQEDIDKGLNVLELFAPDDHPAVIEDIKQILTGIDVENHEYTLLRKDCTTVQALVYSSPIIQDSNITGLRGVVIDITERKRMEEALRESEGKLRTIFDNVNDEIIYVDESGTVIDVNSRVTDIFGYTPDEVIGKNFIDMGVIGPNSMDDIITRFGEAISAGVDDNVTLEVYRKDGNIVYVEASTRLIDLEGIGKRFLVVLRDITNRMKTEELTRIQRDLVHQLSAMTNLSDAIAYCVETAIDATDMDSGGLYLVDSKTQDLNLVYAQGLSDNFVGSASRFDAKSNNAKLIMTGKPVYVLHHELDLPIDDARVREGLQVIAIVPIVHDGTTIGCLNVASHTLGEIPLQSQLTLESIAAQIGSTISHLQALDALRDSEKRFRDLAGLLPQTIFETDLNGICTYANHHGLETFGYTQEDITKGFNTLLLFIPEDRERASQSIQRRLNGEYFQGEEYTVLKKDGSMIPISLYTDLIIQNDKPIGLRGIAVDITERKRAEEALSTSEKTFRAVFENANDLIVLLGTDGTILKINGRSKDIFGFEEDDVIGKNFAELDFARADDIEKITHLFIKSVSGEKAPEFIEFEFTRKDGYSIPLEVSWSFISNDGEIENVLVIVRDISERKRAEAEASRARELEEVEQLRTALLASVSHELRTPLAAIKGMADSLQLPDVEWDDETKRDFLKSISRETGILTHIVEDLVQMSQLEAGITKMEKVPSTLSSVVVRLKDQLERSSKKHSLQIDIPRDLPPIEVDEVHIAQVIGNLVSNAASYSDSGTRITLTARVKGDEIVLSVSDQGIGIAPENANKIFDRFYRLEPGVAHRRGGTGLGLSISKAIVEGHGGRIWVESNGPGTGSTFYFTLPAAP